MNKYPDLTYTILSSKEFRDDFHYDLAVDWACEMLEHGYETEHLLILAATTKPTNQFESGLYLDKAFAELGLNYVYGIEALVAQSWRYINAICNSTDVSDNLYEIYKLCEDGFGAGVLGDFWRLSMAWSEPESLEYHLHVFED